MFEETLITTDDGFEYWARGEILGFLSTHYSETVEDYYLIREGNVVRRLFLHQYNPSVITLHKLIDRFTSLLVANGQTQFLGFFEKGYFTVTAEGITLCSKGRTIAMAKRSPTPLQWTFTLEAKGLYQVESDVLDEELRADYRHWILSKLKPYAGHQLQLLNNYNFSYNTENLYLLSKTVNIPEVKMYRRVPVGDEVKAIIVGCILGRPFSYVVTFNLIPMDVVIHRLREVFEYTFGISFNTTELMLEYIVPVATVGRLSLGFSLNAGNDTLGYWNGPDRPVIGYGKKRIVWLKKFFGYKIDEIDNLEGILESAMIQAYAKLEEENTREEGNDIVKTE